MSWVRFPSPAPSNSLDGKAFRRSATHLAFLKFPVTFPLGCSGPVLRGAVADSKLRRTSTRKDSREPTMASRDRAKYKNAPPECSNGASYEGLGQGCGRMRPPGADHARSTGTLKRNCSRRVTPLPA